MNSAVVIPFHTYRPALMGLACDACVANPARATNPDVPPLAPCANEATTRFVIADGQYTYVFKRCDRCAAALRTKVEKGTVLEILAEEAIDVTR